MNAGLATLLTEWDAPIVDGGRLESACEQR
jgi:hypothetical protein